MCKALDSYTQALKAMASRRVFSQGSMLYGQESILVGQEGARLSHRLSVVLQQELSQDIRYNLC